MEEVTWRTTLHDSVRGFGSISDFASTCVKLGYPYMCWNDRIYAVHKRDGESVKWVDTNLFAEDVGRNYTPTTKDFIVLACSMNGEPALVVFDVEYTHDQYHNGDHYQAAIEKAEEEGYTAPFIGFDKDEYQQVINMAEQLNKL